MIGLRRLLELADRIAGRHRALRFAAIVLVYATDVAGMFWLAYGLRWDFSPPPVFLRQCAILVGPVVLCKLLLLDSFGQFRTVMSYFGLADFGGVVLSMATAGASMMALWFVAATAAAPPRGVIIMDFVLSVGILSSFRLSLRLARAWSDGKPGGAGLRERRVAIVGAGDAGEALARDLLARRGSGLVPVFFVDDDPKMAGRSIHGLPVLGPLGKIAKSATAERINEFLITSAEAGPKRVKEVVELGRQVGANARIVPSFAQMASGEVRMERIRPVAIEDLLGREAVNLDSDAIRNLLRERIVMVTGAGGSIGSELCRQIAALGPGRLVMVDQAEGALFEIEQELIGAGYEDRILGQVVDVADEPAIRGLFGLFRPEIVFHAAAHKHVPLMERQPAEAVKNNTLASAALARVASEHGTERFVLISTDKAINPTSVMGCSKRIAERALQAAQRMPGNRTVFLAVRFGNVLGSSGSVIPTFRRQIANGGPVTVTHGDMTRYFMTIPEAAGLVLQAAALGRGGEIFILDMGDPVRIVDLARQMIELSGYRPGADIEIRITGMRPGEKLFEELRHTGETHEPTEHPRIFRLRSEPGQGAAGWLSEIAAAVATGDPRTIKQAMRKVVPEYSPYEN